jgi:hypothetical protein
VGPAAAGGPSGPMEICTLSPVFGYMQVQLGVRSVYVGSSSSRVTSLPKAWCETIGAKKGDKVRFVMREDGVLEVTKDGI